jgi:hypothetical protein
VWRGHSVGALRVFSAGESLPCRRIGDDVSKPVGRIWRGAFVALLGLFLVLSLSSAQQDEEPGRFIGKVSIKEDLIVMELNDGALGKANLFDLNARTLHFTPEGSQYRAESGTLRWHLDYGRELTGGEVSLHQFTFPFSGKLWKSLLVGTTGSIRFGASEKDTSLDPYGHRDGGIILDRFDQLAEVAGKLTDKAPAICVFLKPRMSGPIYAKELSDRVVITWDLTEPFGGLLDFTWFKTINRFQVVLNRDGSIEMSYKELTAKDAIVGIYPLPEGAVPCTNRFTTSFRQNLRIYPARSLRLSVTSLMFWPTTPIFASIARKAAPRVMVRWEGTLPASGKRNTTRRKLSSIAVALTADSSWASHSLCMLARTKCSQRLPKERPSAAATT